jgi:hypothetical protein
MVSARIKRGWKEFKRSSDIPFCEWVGREKSIFEIGKATD